MKTFTHTPQSNRFRALSLSLLLLATALMPLAAGAQDWNNPKYLKGAVTQNEQGIVAFTRTYECPGKSRAELFGLLRDYLRNDLFKGENALNQCRLVENDSVEGLLAARMDEYLYFSRKAFVTHRTRFTYELIFQVADNSFSVEMRNLRYLYEEQETPNAQPLDIRAEKWITDAEALSKKGTLLRKPRKFRVFTIERKDEIFSNAARLCGAKANKKVVEEY